ncbi:MAG: C45 family peptidase [Oscillospiraceae bacterium]
MRKTASVFIATMMVVLALQLSAYAAPATAFAAPAVVAATAATATATSESTVAPTPAEAATGTAGNGALTAAAEGETFENGRKVSRGAIKIADLRGTWYEMGRQYGKLMSAELNDVRAFVELVVEASDDNKAKADKVIATQNAQMTYTLRQFFAGAVETSGMTEYELHLCNAVERIAGLPQCSAAAVWGDYAADTLLMGRNYDYMENFDMLSDDVVVTVYHPADGSLATATIGYTGEIYAVNAMNEKGIFMELNNGTPSAKIKSPDARITGTTALFEVMFEAETLDYLDIFFNTTACSSSYIINVVDSQSARSYEWCPTGVKRGDGVLPDGLMVSANHYLNPDWTFEVPTDDTSWQSITRRQNLIDLCNKEKGSIDAQKMMQIIETPLEDGGAMNPLTVYQIVAEPQTMTLWLKVVDASDWTQIDMASFLKG